MKINSKSKKKLFLLFFLFCVFFVSGGIINYLLSNNAIKSIPDDIVITNNTYIYDNGDCLSDYSEAFLENKIKTFANENDCKLFFVSVKSIHGENAAQVAKAMRTHFDASAEKRTALILISNETAEIAIANGPALDSVFTKEYKENIKINFSKLDNTADTYSDSLQKISIQILDDIYAEKEIVDDYGKIFVKSNMDMLIVCGLCAVIFTIIAFTLLKNGKNIQKVIDDEKEQERLEFLDEKKKEDALMQENKTPSPSPSSTISPPSSFLFSDKDSFEKIWSQHQDNKNTIDDAVSELIDDNK